MPVYGHFIGAILSARYYYSIKIRRGPLAGPSDGPRCWVAPGVLFWGAGGPRPPGLQGYRGLPLLYAALCAIGGWLALAQTTAFARRWQMRTPQRKAGRAARSVGKATRRTPPKPPARLGWPRTGQRGPGVRYASRPRRAQRARMGRRRPREAAGPPPYRGQRRPSTYGATGTGRQALQGWRSHRRSRLWPCKG